MSAVFREFPLPIVVPANPLLAEACRAHGGVERWNRIDRITLQLRVRPWLFATKFLWPKLRRLTVDVDARRTRAVLSPFPKPGFRGVWEGDVVRIETDAGDVVSELANARAEATRRWVWNDLHALSFFGYAFWNYTHTPFLFAQPGFEVETQGDRGKGSKHRRILNVRHPDGFPTHAREQEFHFDDAGLLRRLDYVAEIFGPMFHGAHFTDDPKPFDGLVYATHRYVRPIFFGHLVPLVPVAIEGWIDGVTIHTLQAPTVREAPPIPCCPTSPLDADVPP